MCALVRRRRDDLHRMMIFKNPGFFRPLNTAPREMMKRRPRETTKGTTEKTRTGVARTIPFNLWSNREKDQTPTVPIDRMPCWEFGLALSPLRNTRPIHLEPVVSLAGITRPREHDARRDPRFHLSCILHSLEKNHEKPLKLRPKKGQKPTVPAVGSRVRPLGLQSPCMETPVLCTLGL